MINAALDDENKRVRIEAWDALIKIKATRDLIEKYNSFSEYKEEPIRSKFLYAFAKIGDWYGVDMVVGAYLFGRAEVELLKMTGEKAVGSVKSSLWSAVNNPVNLEYFDRCFSTLSLLGGEKARNILEEYEIQQMDYARRKESLATKGEKIIEIEKKTGVRNPETGKLYMGPQHRSVYLSPKINKEKRDEATQHRKVAEIARKILASWES